MAYLPKSVLDQANQDEFDTSTAPMTADLHQAYQGYQQARGQQADAQAQQQAAPSYHLPSPSDLFGAASDAVSSAASSVQSMLPHPSDLFPHEQQPAASADPSGSAPASAAPGPAPSSALGASGVPTAMPGGGAPGTRPAGPTSDMSDEAWARQEATRLGIDPDTAVRVGNSEGGFTQPGRQNMEGAPAYSAYQDYIGGPDNPGLGDEMLAHGIDPRDPAQSKQAITYSLEHAARNGWSAFQGAARVGIGDREGIGQAPSQAQPATSQTPQTQGADTVTYQDQWGNQYTVPQAKFDARPGGNSDVTVIGHGQPLAHPSTATTPPPAPAPSPSQPSSGWEVDQAALDDPDKWSLCGPVAAVMAAGRRGAAWTVAQAKQIAQASGLWDSGNGMHGLGTEVDLLNRMGVSARLGDANAQQLAADAQAGNTPIISTNRHYFILKGYDPSTGKFDTTTSGSVLKGGSRYLSLDEIATLGGGIQGAAYMDNPSSPTPSVAAPPTAGVTPAPAGSPSASAAVAPPAADAPDPLRQQLDQSGNAGPASLKVEQPQDDPGQAPTGIDYSGRKPAPDYQVNPNGPIMTGAPFTTINGDVPFLGTNRNRAVYGPSIQEGPEPVQTFPPPSGPLPPEPNRAVQGEPVYDGPVDVRGFPAGSGGWPTQMYRQPLGATMGPDTTTGDQQPYDPDQGPHEATPGSVGAEPVGPLYGPPDTPANDVPPAPTSPQAPSGFPGLQAVYDQAGNFLHWIQSTAQGVQNQVDSQMAGPVQSTPGEPDYVPPSNPVQRWIDTPIAQPPDQPPPSDPALAAGRLYMPPYPQSLVPRDVGADMQRFGPRTLEAVREAAQAVQQSSTDTQQAISQSDLIGTIWNGAKTAIGAMNVPFTGVTSSIDNALPSYDVHGTGFGTAIGDAQVAIDVGHALAVGIKITPKVVAALRAGVPVDRLIELAGRGLNSAADTIDRGIGAAGSALDANAARVAAGDARSAGTVLPGTLGVVTGNPLDANAAAASRVVPPHVADTLDFPVRVPTDPGVIRAIEAAGGSVDPERGVNLHVIRQQGPEAAGQTATRGSTFYTAGRPGEASPYAGPAGSQTGGSERIEAPTTYRSPLVLPDAPGSAQGFDQGMETLNSGRNEAERIYTEAKSRRDEAYAQADRNNPTPEQRQVIDQAEAVYQRAYDAYVQARQQAPRSADIDQGIRDARRAGPPGSPARAQALKDLVTRYGGDPAPIDDLLSLRGADNTESAWAIKENILAHNARAKGYDGVLTVQPRDATMAEIDAHPAVQQAREATKAANTAEEAAWAETSRLYREGGKQGQPEYDAAYQRWEQASGRTRAAMRQEQAAEQQAGEELRRGHITELADFREAANPTPSTSGEAWKAAHQQVVAAADHADAMAQAMDRAEVHGTPAEWKAARKTWGDARRAYDAAVNAREALRSSEPGYTLRSDLPIRPTGDVGAADSRAAQRPQTASATAGVLPSSTRGAGALNAVTQEAGRVATGGVGGATIGAGLPADTPEERRRNALLGAGVGMVAGPALSRLATRGAGGALASLGAIPERDSVQAAIRAAAARGDSAEVARLRSALPEGRNVALPGMEPSGLPAVQTPHAQQTMAEALPGMVRSLGRPPVGTVTSSAGQSMLAEMAPNPGAIRRVVSAVSDAVAPWANRINILRYAGMLSDTATHIFNLTSNTLLQGLDLATTPVAAALDVGRVAAARALNAAAGTSLPTGRQVFFREVPARIAGMRAGAQVGLRAATDILRTGDVAEGAQRLDQATRGFGTDIPGLAPAGSTAANVVNLAAEAPLRALAASDAVFRSTALGGHLMAEAYAAATIANKGMAPTDAMIRAAAQSPEVLARVQNLGARSVLQENRALTAAYQKFLRDSGPLGALVSVEVPFVKTPYNVVAQGVGLTPIGLAGAIKDMAYPALKAPRYAELQQQIRSLQLADPPGAAQQIAALQKQAAAYAPVSARHIEHTIARAALGTALMVPAAAAYASGDVTGPRPTDPKEASTLPVGWQPWSRKHTIGQTTFYTPLAIEGPLAMPAVLSILMGEAHKQHPGANTLEQAGQVALGLGQYAEQASFFGGVATIAQTLDPRSGGTVLSRNLAQVAAQFSPHVIGGGALGKEIQRVMGMPMRDPQGAIDSLLATFPYQDQVARALGRPPVLPRQDTLGRPVVQTGNSPVMRAVSPVLRSSVQRNDGVIRAFRSAGQGLPLAAPKQITDPSTKEQTPLTPRQQHAWRRAFGDEISQSWDDAGNPDDAKTLSGLESDARRVADETVLGLR